MPVKSKLKQFESILKSFSEVWADVAPSRPAKAKTIGVTPDADLLAWLTRRMGPGERWSGPTHFFNWAAKRARDEEEGLLEALRQGRIDTFLDVLSSPDPKEPPAPKARRRSD